MLCSFNVAIKGLSDFDSNFQRSHTKTNSKQHVDLDL